ncbi:MAG: tetratricopeptide repeat protein [Elusimicrobia bacterium]|nr:tetratricopeptide repeat protein [Elusimicrobiota bacterium]
MRALSPSLRKAAVGFALAGALWRTSASADLARTPALDDAHAAELWARADSARYARRSASSLRAVERLLASFPAEPRYLSLEAEDLERLQRPLDAARSWELFMKSAPFPTDACPRLGRDYEAAGLPEAALDAHRRCLSLDTTQVDLMIYLARALRRAGRYEEATSLYARAARRAPKDLDATLGPILIDIRRGQTRRAEAALAPLEARAPRNCDVLLVRGRLSLKENRPARARDALEQAARLCPGYPEVLRDLLRAQTVLNDAEGARRTQADLSARPGARTE